MGGVEIKKDADGHAGDRRHALKLYMVFSCCRSEQLFLIWRQIEPFCLTLQVCLDLHTHRNTQLLFHRFQKLVCRLGPFVRLLIL